MIIELTEAQETSLEAKVSSWDFIFLIQDSQSLLKRVWLITRQNPYLSLVGSWWTVIFSSWWFCARTSWMLKFTPKGKRYNSDSRKKLGFKQWFTS